MSDIRKDPMSDTWVIIAPQRASRPHVLNTTRVEEESDYCPFCESDEIKTPIAPHSDCSAIFDEEGNWVTRVLANKFPALTIEGSLEQENINQIYHKLSGVGAHEILVESPVHNYFSWATMPVSQLEAIFTNYRCRYSYWRKDQRMKYLSIFRNHGKVAGASVKHPHSQMVATPFIPPRIQSEIRQLKNHFEQTNHCLMCHILDLELKTNDRLILENADFAAISNFAPRFPYETLIVPKKHAASFEDINDNQIKSLSSLVSALFRKFDSLLADPPFNVMLHVSPLKSPNSSYYHWHMEIIFRLSQPAGFEWGSGVYINSVSPEEATKQLREV